MSRLLFITLLFALGSQPAWGFDAKSSCVSCHGDKEKMKALGNEALFLDPAAVDREVGMKGEPSCTDCHLGDKNGADAATAHQGMVRPFVMAVGKKVKGEAVSRSEIGLTPLEPKKKGSPMGAMLPKGDEKLLEQKEIKRITGLFYHDRDPETFAYSPKVATQTCGRCHTKEVKDYNSSSKGLLKHQRAYASFAEQLPGPQNCGPWFGNNYEQLKKDTAVPYSPQMNALNDRQCNVCHAGCNDCHFKPFKGEGRHLFGKPETPSCYGGARGSICHAGPMDRRRGSGFLRGEYSFPANLPTDVHARKGLDCLACHKPVDHNFGHLASDDARRSCQRCHADIVAAVEDSLHKNVDCGSCHIKEVGAYQYTFWGPGNVAGSENPYAKHKEYYGIRDLPTLIKNPAGRWIPVKPYPMAVLNQTGELAPSGLQFRAIPARTLKGNSKIGEPETFTVARGAGDVNDAYISNGTRKDLPSGNKAILWVQIDKMSHALGQARDCASCHDSKAQVGRSTYTYNEEKNVSEPFSGSYTIIADAQGMRFVDQKTGPIKVAKGRNAIDFAPFTQLPTDAWNVQGIDFSIPFKPERVQLANEELKTFLAKLSQQPQNDRTKVIRAVAYHNLAAAKKMAAKAN